MGKNDPEEVAEAEAEVPVLSLLAVIHASICGEHSAGLCRQDEQASLMQEKCSQKEDWG